MKRFLKGVLLPIIIGVAASLLFALSLTAILYIVAFVTRLPLIGFVVNLLLLPSYYASPVYVFIWAFAAVLVALGFISLATRYDRNSQPPKAARRASATFGLITTLVLAAIAVVKVSSEGFNSGLLVNAIPFAIVVFVIFNSNK